LIFLKTAMNQTSKTKSVDPKDLSSRPLVSIILPAFNEEAILEKNVSRLQKYLKTLDTDFRWEVLIVNDGSTDQTGTLAETMAKSFKNITVLHHNVNRNLGTALRTGFANSNGDYVVVLDIDLSYAPDHIARLLAKIQESEADMVIASPYMKGGKSSAVPWLRLFLSKTVNFMMQKASRLNICTFTGMVRAYKGDFIRSLNTKSTTFDINSEIILKAYILRAVVREIPAHLDWSDQKKMGKSRTSSLQIVKGVFNGLVNSFIFRPYMFFWLSGLVVLLFSLYLVISIAMDTYHEYLFTVHMAEGFENRLSLAIAKVYGQRPISFVLSSTSLIIAVQLLGLAFISLQKKRYFDELFHLNSTILKATKKK